MRLAAVAAAAALALAAPAAAAPPKQGVLDPGRSLGGIRLGDRAPDGQRRSGHSFGACAGCAVPTWYFNYVPFQPQGAGVSFARGRVAALFTLWSPTGWRTPAGLRLGDSAVRITELYGALDRVDCPGYYALRLLRGATVTDFYVVGEKLWGFGLSRRESQPCR